MDTHLNPYHQVIIVGCGGVGSWLSHLLVRLLPKLDPCPVLILQDGDRLEEKNMDRQLFLVEDVGKNKAEALAHAVGRYYYKTKAEPTYFHGFVELPPRSLIICCVDNHPARRFILDAVDLSRDAHCIIAANEFTDAEAYLYLPQWKETPADPRLYYPEILNDDSGDVTGTVTCAELAQSTSPQLAMANYMAAGQAAYLFWFLVTEAAALTGEDAQLWPVHHSTSIFKAQSLKLQDKHRNKSTTNQRTEHVNISLRAEPAPSGGARTTTDPVAA